MIGAPDGARRAGTRARLGGRGPAGRTAGAAILRVHDVAATRDALAVWHAARPADRPRERAAFGSQRFGDED